LPSEWTIAGTNTFGSKVAEHFVYPQVRHPALRRSADDSGTVAGEAENTE